MSDRKHAFIDLVTLPEIRERVLSPEAVLLLSETDMTAIWGNAAAADLFGLPSAGEVAGEPSWAGPTFPRQLRDAARQIDDEPVVRGFRISRGARHDFIQGSLSRLALPGGESGILMTCSDERHVRRRREHELAQEALSTLGQGANAIVDDFGLPIAYSDAFAETDVAPETLEALVARSKRTGGTLRDLAADETGASHTVAIVTLRDAPGRHLVLLDADEASAETPEPAVEADTQAPAGDPSAGGYMTAATVALASGAGMAAAWGTQAQAGEAETELAEESVSAVETDDHFGQDRETAPAAEAAGTAGGIGEAEAGQAWDEAVPMQAQDSAATEAVPFRETEADGADWQETVEFAEAAPRAEESAETASDPVADAYAPSAMEHEQLPQGFVASEAAGEWSAPADADEMEAVTAYPAAQPAAETSASEPEEAARDWRPDDLPEPVNAMDAAGPDGFSWEEPSGHVSAGGTGEQTSWTGEAEAPAPGTDELPATGEAIAPMAEAGAAEETDFGSAATAFAGAPAGVPERRTGSIRSLLERWYLLRNEDGVARHEAAAMIGTAAAPQEPETAATPGAEFTEQSGDEPTAIADPAWVADENADPQGQEVFEFDARAADEAAEPVSNEVAPEAAALAEAASPAGSEAEAYGVEDDDARDAIERGTYRPAWDMEAQNVSAPAEIPLTDLASDAAPEEAEDWVETESGDLSWTAAQETQPESQQQEEPAPYDAAAFEQDVRAEASAAVSGTGDHVVETSMTEADGEPHPAEATADGWRSAGEALAANGGWTPEAGEATDASVQSSEAEIEYDAVSSAHDTVTESQVEAGQPPAAADAADEAEKAVEGEAGLAAGIAAGAASLTAAAGAIAGWLRGDTPSRDAASVAPHGAATEEAAMEASSSAPAASSMDEDRDLAAFDAEVSQADAPVESPAEPPEDARRPDDFTFSLGNDPVRFAWTVDQDHVFLSVSPELAQTVGPNAADIVGRRWSDVAKVFGFDRNGDIARLLEKRDTWSGKTILWPVQGTDLAVPVDLAALPAFSGARAFDGFRGFGIIRTTDAVVDPDETGMALVSGPFEPRDRTGTAARAIPDEQESASFEQDVERRRRLALETGERALPAAISDEGPGFQPPLPANVVDLSSRKRDKGEELSSREVRAFREIGRTLGDDETAGTTAAGETVSQSQPATGPLLEGHAEPLREQATGAGSDEAVNGETPVAQAFGDADLVGADAALPEEQADAAQTSILAQLPVPVIVYRLGETLYANPELLSISGYGTLEALREAGGIDALFDGAGLAEGDNGALRLRRADGAGIDVQPLLKRVPWEGGRALLLTFRPPLPVSAADEKVAVDAARVAELRSILDTATDGIVITTPDGFIESINGPGQALFGISAEAAAGKPLAELFAPECHRPIAEYMREVAEPGLAGLLNDGREVIGREANGGLIPLFVTLGRAGEAGKYCAVLRDITHWKKAEEELVTARRAAESASEQKSEFLARVSHEIRTPLNAIIGFSDVMIEERFGPIDNDRYRGYLRDINRSGVHVLDLINDLLDISKIEAGKMELTYEAVDLNQLVQETVALLQPQANAERIIIRTSLSRAVPRVVADARSIRQIILNLVSNAIKFTPANGQVIVSTVYEGNGEVVLRVRDTGRGMSEREIEYAMKPFHQINVTDERRGQGTGLGLPLTKALVEANRAYFDLESTPGEGTIAHVHFPTQRVLAD